LFIAADQDDAFALAGALLAGKSQAVLGRQHGRETRDEEETSRHHYGRYDTMPERHGRIGFQACPRAGDALRALDRPAGPSYVQRKIEAEMANILAIHAHPDDVEILAGGTLALLAGLGHSITVAT